MIDQVIECMEEKIVEKEHVAEHLAEKGIEVLSTPCLILYMESAARRCLDKYTGKPSVGYRVDVKHRKSVSPGTKLKITVRVFEFDGKRALVYMRAVDEEGKLVGEGINERYIRGK